MPMTLSALASKLGLILKGEDGPFTGLNTLEGATETEISFLANPKYATQLRNTRARAVILSEGMVPQAPSATLVSKNPYMDFARAGELFARKPERFAGISPLAVIDETAVLGEGVVVYPHAFIGPGSVLGKDCVVYPGVFLAGHVTLGDRCVLYPHSVIMDGVVMGDDCVLHSGAVVGTDGFGFIRVEGRMRKIPQIGEVRLGDGVDIGANSCVDRATLGATMVGRDTKIDNLVQVGHNVRIGEQCLLVSQVGIAGSTKVGDRVTMAGHAGIAGHLTIGDDVTIGPMSGVPKDIPAGVTGGGMPFQEGSAFLRTILLTTKLPDMRRKIQQLEKELAHLKQQLSETSFKEET